MRIILGLTFLLISNFAFSQKSAYTWVEAGLKVHYGATHLLNSAIVDDPDIDYEITTGIAYGARIGFNKGKNGLALEAMFSSSEAGFEVDVDNSSTIKWNNLDVYAMYRNNANLGYFEIGPKFSFINGVDAVGGGEDFDIKDATKSPNMGLALGFGAYVLGDDGAFTGLLGLRAEYGFSDFFGNDDEADLVGSFTDDGDSTNPIFAGIVFELNWGIGYWAKAGCGQRAKMVKF